MQSHFQSPVSAVSLYPACHCSIEGERDEVSSISGLLPAPHVNRAWHWLALALPH